MEEQEFNELIEDHADEIYTPGHGSDEFSNAWAVFQIDMTMMAEEARQKVYQAETLLQEAGVRFDRGSGGGFRDWELDWSLSGARLHHRNMRCMGKDDCPSANTKVHLETPLRVLYRHPRGNICVYTYCSPECQQHGIDGKEVAGWEVVLRA